MKYGMASGSSRSVESKIAIGLHLEYHGDFSATSSSVLSKGFGPSKRRARLPDSKRTSVLRPYGFSNANLYRSL